MHEALCRQGHLPIAKPGQPRVPSIGAAVSSRPRPPPWSCKPSSVSCSSASCQQEVSSPSVSPLDSAGLEERRNSHSGTSSSGGKALHQHASSGHQPARVQPSPSGSPNHSIDQDAEQAGSFESLQPLLWEPPSRDNREQLTESIQGCDSTSTLLELLLHHQPRLNPVHLSAAFCRTIQLYRAEARRPSWRTARMITGALLPLLTAQLQSLMPELSHQPRAIASITHSLGCLDARDRELLSSLATLAQGCMSDFSTQGLANMVWAFARCEFQPSGGWMSAFVCACRARIRAFRPQELAMVIWALSKLKYKLSADMQGDFLNHMRALFSESSPQALCMVVYALSSMGHHPGDEWLDDLVENALQPPGLSKFNPQGFSQLLWSLSRIGYKPSDAMVAAVHEHVTTNERMKGFKSIDVSTLLYALARMQLPMSRDMLRIMLDRMQERMFSFQPSQLANVGWALARLYPQLRQLRQWQLQSDSWHLQQQQQQQQLHYVHSSSSSSSGSSSNGASENMSSNGSWDDADHAEAASYQQQQRQQQQQQQHSTYPLPTSVLRKYLAACYMSLDRFTSLDLSMTTWALATLRVVPPAAFITVLLRRIEQVGAEFAPQEVANTLWALARIGAKPSAPIIAEFFSATDRRLSSFKPHELSSMVWALAKMGFLPDKVWADEFLHATFHKLGGLGSQGLTNVIWALAVMPLRPPPAWLYAFVKAVSAEMPAMRQGDQIIIMNSLCSLTAGSQLQKVDECITELQRISGRSPGMPSHHARKRWASLRRSPNLFAWVGSHSDSSQLNASLSPDDSSNVHTAVSHAQEASTHGGIAHDGSSRQQSGAELQGSVQGSVQGQGHYEGSNGYAVPQHSAALMKAEALRAVGITHQQAGLIAQAQARRAHGGNGAGGGSRGLFRPHIEEVGNRGGKSRTLQEGGGVLEPGNSRASISNNLAASGGL